MTSSRLPDVVTYWRQATVWTDETGQLRTVTDHVTGRTTRQWWPINQPREDVCAPARTAAILTIARSQQP